MRNYFYIFSIIFIFISICINSLCCKIFFIVSPLRLLLPDEVVVILLVIARLLPLPLFPLQPLLPLSLLPPPPPLPRLLLRLAPGLLLEYQLHI